MSTVPDELKFLWGTAASPAAAKAKTRDPSEGPYKFPRIPYGKGADQVRAHWSWYTNRLIMSVRLLLDARGEKVTTHQFERALFMLGYDVRAKTTS